MPWIFLWHQQQWKSPFQGSVNSLLQIAHSSVPSTDAIVPNVRNIKYNFKSCFWRWRNEMNIITFNPMMFQSFSLCYCFTFNIVICFFNARFISTDSTTITIKTWSSYKQGITNSAKTSLKYKLNINNNPNLVTK